MPGETCEEVLASRFVVVEVIHEPCEKVNLT
jgi:hypothetical protein